MPQSQIHRRTLQIYSLHSIVSDGLLVSFGRAFRRPGRESRIYEMVLQEVRLCRSALESVAVGNIIRFLQDRLMTTHLGS